MNLFTEYSVWWSVPCFILGALYAFILYRKESSLVVLSAWLRRGLMLLRAIVVAGIALLLLGPFFKYIERQIQKPIVLIAQDNSSSVLLSSDSAKYKSTYLADIEVLTRTLEAEFEVQRYTFDQDLNNTFEVDYAGKQSDIGKAISDMMERNINRNVGAVVLASDGIFNKGISPAYVASSKGVPIYTIALGDTTVRRDLLIENIAHNRLAYLGNEFPVEILLRADRFRGEESIVRIRKNGEELFKKNVEIDDDAFVLSVPSALTAKNIGRQRYDVSISPLDGELSETNNYRSFYIDILDSRQKVLIVYKTPHPDISSIRNAIESNENYEVVVRNITSFNSDLSDFDLVILHGLPDTQNANVGILQKVKDQQVPVWVIGGLNVSWKALQEAGFGIEAQLKGGTNSTDASPSFQRGFSLFALSDEFKNSVANWSPIRTSFADYFAEPSARVLFEQRIGVVDTDQPLWVFSELDGYKTALTVGEGIWRWRMQNYAERGNHEQFDELVSRTVQFLATKEDRRQFRVYGKDKFDEDQRVILEAELYNKSFEPVNDPEVDVEFVDTEGNEFEFVFNRTQNSYYLDAGKLPSGQYSYSARVNFDGKEFRAGGTLTVEAILIESVRTKADHQLLYRISESTGASMFYPDQLKDLSSAIIAKEEIVPLIYSTEQMTDLIESKWLLFLFIGLLAIEWFIRKYKGSY